MRFVIAGHLADTSGFYDCIAYNISASFPSATWQTPGKFYLTQILHQATGVQESIETHS